MRYISAFSFGVFISIAILVALIQMQRGIPTSSSKWAHDLYLVKEQHAASAHANKILIVAGSNSLFGIATQEIEKQFNIPTTNFGVHAGLGLRYILERSKDSLEKGDIAYLPLEYALYQQDAIPSAQLMDFLLARDPQYLDSLPVLHKLIGYTNVSFNRIVEGLRGGTDQYLGRSARIYNVANVDASGNQVNNTAEKAVSYSNQLNQLEPKDIGAGSISDYSRRVLIEYIDWAKRNDICLIGAPPNLLRFNKYESPEYLEFFKQIVEFYREHDIYFAGNPSDYLFPINYFFDTEYHLNEKGVAVRTQMTIKDIGQQPEIHCAKSAA